MANFIDFHVLGLYAGSINTTSGIFAGENLQYGWRSSNKINLAMGKICGDYNAIVGGRQEVVDPDYVDTYVQKPLPFTDARPPSPALIHAWIDHKKRKWHADEWD